MAYKIGIPPTNEKYKLQMRYEREPSPFEKRHADVNNRVPSPEKVREELLDQINEKKLNEWHENAVISTLSCSILNYDHHKEIEKRSERIH